MNPAGIYAIDIGNTCTDVGYFENHTLLHRETYPSNMEGMQELCRALNTGERNRVVLASVVPALSDGLSSKIVEMTHHRPLQVDPMKGTLLPLLVDNPSTVGVDRVVNSYAALTLYGSPALVISLGTATTFEVISKEGAYMGGAIAPGIRISLDTLTAKTALLPPTDIRKPDRLIATDTVGHMQSGIYYGTLSLMEGMIRRFQDVLGSRVQTIGTGGLSSLFAEEGIFNYHEPDLTLKGLELIYTHQA